MTTPPVFRDGQNGPIEIVLASASPRRRDLLATAGLKFIVSHSGAEERPRARTASGQVMELASLKAGAVMNRRLESDPAVAQLVIGADTLVEHDGQIFGKPGEVERAREMLLQLSGNEHRVYTGVTVWFWSPDHPDQSGSMTDYEQTTVRFAPLTREQIERYIATGEPLDKAGGYGIQGAGAFLVSMLFGDYSNVVGLPMRKLYELAGRLGIDLLCCIEHDHKPETQLA